MDKHDLIWNYAHEQRMIGQGMDEQRTAIGNYVMILVGGLMTVLSVKGFGSETIPVAAFIVVLGTFGMISTRKLYERSKYHFNRSGACLKALDQDLAGEFITRTNKDSLSATNSSFPIISKFQTNQVWMALHFMVIIFGIVLVMLCVIGKSHQQSNTTSSRSRSNPQIHLADK